MGEVVPFMLEQTLRYTPGLTKNKEPAARERPGNSVKRECVDHHKRLLWTERITFGVSCHSSSEADVQR